MTDLQRIIDEQNTVQPLRPARNVYELHRRDKSLTPQQIEAAGRAYANAQVRLEVVKLLLDGVRGTMRILVRLASAAAVLGVLYYILTHPTARF